MARDRDRGTEVAISPFAVRIDACVRSRVQLNCHCPSAFLLGCVPRRGNVVEWSSVTRVFCRKVSGFAMRGKIVVRIVARSALFQRDVVH